MPQAAYDFGLAEQSLKLAFNGREYIHWFRSPVPDECIKYLSLFHSQQKTSDFKTFEPDSDVTDANFYAWETLIQRIENYTSRTEGDLSAREDWKQRVPAAHKAAFGSAVMNVVLVRVHEQEFFDDPLVVELAAIQNNVLITNLLHRFNPPETMHVKEWNRTRARQKIEISGGSTIIHGVNRLKVQVQLYKELVLGVENYVFAGQPIQSATDAIGMVLPHHKAMSLTALFEALMAKETEKTSPLQ